MSNRGRGTNATNRRDEKRPRNGGTFLEHERPRRRIVCCSQAWRFIKVSRLLERKHDGTSRPRDKIKLAIWIQEKGGEMQGRNCRRATKLASRGLWTIVAKMTKGPLPKHCTFPWYQIYWEQSTEQPVLFQQRQTQETSSYSDQNWGQRFFDVMARNQLRERLTCSKFTRVADVTFALLWT